MSDSMQEYSGFYGYPSNEQEQEEEQYDGSYQEKFNHAMSEEDTVETIVRREFDGIESFISNEEVSDEHIDLERACIDYVFTQDGRSKFISAKVRTMEETPHWISSPEEVGVPQRILGRSGSTSPEWRKFVDSSEKVPHYLILAITKGDELVRYVVIDFLKLKEIYTSGRMCVYDADRTHVPYYDENGIETSEPLGMTHSRDAGLAVYLDQPDILETSAIVGEWTSDEY